MARSERSDERGEAGARPLPTACRALRRLSDGRQLGSSDAMRGEGLRACHPARTGETVQWDPARETIVDIERAAAMMARPYRAPWKLG